MLQGITNVNGTTTGLLLADISPIHSLPNIPGNYALTASSAGTLLPEAAVVVVRQREDTPVKPQAAVVAIRQLENTQGNLQAAVVAISQPKEPQVRPQPEPAKQTPVSVKPLTPAVTAALHVELSA